MAKKTLSREAKKLANAVPKQPLAATKPEVKVKEASPQSALLQPPVVEAVAEPIEIVKKPKKARFVREKKEKQPKANAAPLPTRSTTRTGKLMSRNIKQVPKEEPASGPKRHFR